MPCIALRLAFALPAGTDGLWHASDQTNGIILCRKPFFWPCACPPHGIFGIPDFISPLPHKEARSTRKAIVIPRQRHSRTRRCDSRCVRTIFTLHVYQRRRVCFHAINSKERAARYPVHGHSDCVSRIGIGVRKS